MVDDQQNTLTVRKSEDDVRKVRELGMKIWYYVVMGNL